MKQIKIGADARKEAVHALQFIAQAVGTTLGPKGLNFIIEKSNSLDNKPSPVTSKDGISVMKSFDFTDPIQHAVHSFCVQASSHTVFAAGDGPQPLYAKVLTPTGFVKMQDIQVGMEICGTNGTIQKVLGVFPKGDKEIYEVEFPNNRIVECCEDHLWTVANATRTYQLETKTTKEIQTNYIYNKPCGTRQFRYFTPRTVVEFNDNQEDMPLDPYLVGVLLGDGSLSGTGSVEICLGEKKEHIIEKMKLPEGFSLTKTYSSEKNAFRVKIKGQDSTGKTIHEVVNSVGLLGVKSHTKFIPKSYLYSSVENRTKLLQGLIDTDGYINSRGAMEFSSVSEALVNDFAELCRSLGKTANVSVMQRKEGDGSYSDKPIHRVNVTQGRKYGDKIVRITKTGKTTEMQCIKVSNPDNLYITDNYIVTHNTTSTICLAAAIAKEILDTNPEMPQAFARQIQAQAEKAIAAIAEEADRSPSLAESVALTSANGDAEMVKHTMEAVEDNPLFGSIIIERAPAAKERYVVKKQDGLTAGRGYNQHLQFAHSFSDKTAENAPFDIEAPFIILYDGDLVSKGQIAPLLNKLSQQVDGPWQAVIVAYEIGQEVANTLAEINIRNAGRIRLWASSIRLTAEVNSGWHRLQDLASFTGAEIVNHGMLQEEGFSRSMAGVCTRVQVTPEKTIFLGRSPNHWIPKRALQNETGIENAATELDRERIRERNAELVNGLVKLVVGGGHMAGIQERADRCDDAIRAAQACLRSGALPGCGASYIRAGELAGVGPELKRAFRCIHDQIMQNFGLPPVSSFAKGEVVAIKDSEATTGDFRLLRIADSFDTISSVIRNATELAVLFSTLGGFSLSSDLQEIEQIQRVKSVMG